MHTLGKLLGEKGVTFDATIRSLEKATGNKGIDTKLIGDILQKAHTAVRAIGLSNDDLRAKEVYQGMRVCDNSDVFIKTDYTLYMIGSSVVSFNGRDIEHDNEEATEFSKRQLSEGRAALRKEIARRYRAQGKEKSVVVERLLTHIIPKEKK